MTSTPTASEITVVESKKDREKFLEFPYRLYQNDKYWVAPLKMEQKKLIDTEENPFYENAEIELFLARQGGEVCGRIAAIIDRRYNEFHNSKTGFFGFFESIDDTSIAKLLVKVARGWVKDQGCNEIMGPANPGMMDEIGILVDGFDKYPSIMMPYHKQYYDGLLTKAGLKKVMDMHAYRVTQESVKLDRMRRAGKIVRKRNPNLNIREVNLKKLDEEVQIVRRIFNEAWSENWGFIPLTESELEALAEDLKMILDPRYAHVAEIDGEPVAFSVALPDLNQALKQMNGRLFPFGIFKLLWYRRKINSIRTALMGVLPEYRGKGIDALLHLKAIENGREDGMTSSELGWVLETNEGMKRVAENLGAHIEKTYRMYRMEL